eukprot:8312702-Pyramimonas_sp.AAC.1
MKPRRERPVTASSSLMFSFQPLELSADSGGPWSRADLVEAVRRALKSCLSAPIYKNVAKPIGVSMIQDARGKRYCTV